MFLPFVITLSKYIRDPPKEARDRIADLRAKQGKFMVFSDVF